MSALWMVLVLLGVASGSSSSSSSSGSGSSSSTFVELSGDNVCIEQRPETRVVNETYMESHEVKRYEWCANIPPRCARWETKLSTRYRERNITRLVNHHSCCKGYEQVDDHCEPVCSQKCLRGTCVEPEVCQCDPGFSGEDCSEVGCPGGNWGLDCSKPCPCSNEGRCEPHTGRCLCLPGWEGLRCQTRCDQNHYGQDCLKKCKCQKLGHTCHHVTGECMPCPEGTFGQDCSGNCTCEAPGTALCYHENGNCFCKSNYYGRKCEMLCPFGYLDGICHKEPMAQGTCSCPSDLYRCDTEHGCVCKDGFDCEGGTQIIDFSPLSANQETSGASTAGVATLVAILLLLALVATVLAVLYYRRRMRRMQKDLENRSVRYIENSVSGGRIPPINKHEMIIVTNDSVDIMNGARPRSTVIANNQAVSNNTSSARGSSFRAEKNVNLDRFKLGDEDDDADEEEDLACCSDVRGCSEEAAEILPPVNKDPNLFYDDADKLSPSKEKNNAKLADLYRKVSKTNVDVVINTFDRDNAENEALEDGDEDEMDPKTFVNLKGHPEGGGANDDA